MPQIFIRTLIGTSIALDVEPNVTIAQLKMKIYEKGGLPPFRQKIIRSGVEAINPRSANSYEGIVDGSCLIFLREIQCSDAVNSVLIRDYFADDFSVPETIEGLTTTVLYSRDKTLKTKLEKIGVNFSGITPDNYDSKVCLHARIQNALAIQFMAKHGEKYSDVPGIFDSQDNTLLTDVFRGVVVSPVADGGAGGGAAAASPPTLSYASLDDFMKSDLGFYTKQVPRFSRKNDIATYWNGLNEGARRDILALVENLTVAVIAASDATSDAVKKEALLTLIDPFASRSEPGNLSRWFQEVVKIAAKERGLGFFSSPRRELGNTASMRAFYNALLPGNQEVLEAAIGHKIVYSQSVFGDSIAFEAKSSAGGAGAKSKRL